MKEEGYGKQGAEAEDPRDQKAQTEKEGTAKRAGQQGTTSYQDLKTQCPNLNRIGCISGKPVS
jgi:hypothetical protein